MPTVRKVEATINPKTMMPLGLEEKKKVAAYARVSTDSDEQYTSYEAQCTYYENFIKAHQEWEFVNVYADEGITGTNTKRRAQFNKMIDDAMDGKINLILTKSISRFARNTLDAISITRKLRSKSIEVYFEKENLWSLDMKTELILTILASIAQEESRSISQNVTIGKRWLMARGVVSWAYKNFLGFKKEGEQIVVDEEEAKVVKWIYSQFLRKGNSLQGIARELRKQNIPTPSRKGSNWTYCNVISILTNEKYYGDALLQKTYTCDFLEHKSKKNNGELPQYYVENHHPAIILQTEWDQVQHELERRQALGKRFSATDPFACKLVCGDCGGFYGRKVLHSNDAYRSEKYRCNEMYKKGKEKCTTPFLTEESIKAKFLKAYNGFVLNRDEIIQDTLLICSIIDDTNELDEGIYKCQAEIEIVEGLVEKLISDNKAKPQSQEEYQKRYDELLSRYEKAKKELDGLKLEKERKRKQRSRLDGFVENLKASPNIITEWNEDLWNLLIEKGTVLNTGEIIFKFYNGYEVKID